MLALSPQRGTIVLVSPPGILAHVGRRVREARGHQGLTQKQLASKAGLSLRFLSQLEKGEGNISLTRFAELAHALDRSPASLLEETEAAPGATVVALVGLRGAGKSTIGPVLAHRMQAGFVELDEAIEEAAGLRLAEIFELHGEAYYRRLERETLRHVLRSRESLVLATGGGVVTDPDTFRVLQNGAITVWLEAAPEDHWNRVLEQGDSRPMAENPHAFAELRALLAARKPLYAACRHRVNTSTEVDAAELAARIHELVT